MKYFNKEVKIALVVLSGMVILYFGMNFLKGKNLFSDDHLYYITFDDISGLAPSAPIYANGFKIGRVTDLNYDYSGEKAITAAIEVDRRLHIPKGSYAEIESDMLGNVRVNLILADRKNGLFNVGDRIPGSIAQGAMGKAAGMIPQIERLLPKVDTLLANLNTLTANPDIARTISNTQKITNDLTVTTAEINKLMARLNREMPAMMHKANTVLDHTGTLTANLAAVDVEKTMGEVEQTINSIKLFADKLNSNNGSLGKLLNDESLYNNLNTTIASADSLMVNLRENPKRYVHFSIFGRKNK